MPYPGCPLELPGRMGDECGCGGVEVLKELDEDEDEEELDKEDPGDWTLLLDKEKGPGKELQSSTETSQNRPNHTVSDLITFKIKTDSSVFLTSFLLLHTL